jgi:hypothetical protein
MNTNEALSKTEAAISATEQKLSILDDTEAQVSDLSKSIEELSQEEADLLASDQSESKKLAALLKIRATIDVRKSSLAKLNAEIGALQDKAIALGIFADRFLCAIRDALVAFRTDQILAELGKLFKASVLLELKRFTGWSLAVAEVEDGHDRFTWVWTKPENCLANARNLRSEFNRLSAMVQSEPEIEIVTSEGWTVPVPPAGRYNRSVAFVGSKS